MSKGLKIFIIICASLIALGVVLTGIGHMLGGTGKLTTDKLLYNLPFHWGGSHSNSLFSGVIIKDGQNLEEFTNVDIDMSLSEINFLPGDTYRVEYAYDEKYGEPVIQVTDGLLSIRDKFPREELDLNLRTLRNLGGSPGKLYVKIYFPAGNELRNVNIDNNLGSLTLKDVKVTDKITASLDMGECHLVNVTAEQAELSLDMGDLSCKNFHTNNLSASADMGSIYLQGAFYGRSEVDCDMGDVKIITSIPREEYGYEVEIDMGSFTLAGQKMGSPYISNSGASNLLDVEANMGSVTIDFQD